MPDQPNNTLPDILRQDVLSTVPFVSSVYKAKFTVAQDLGQCTFALAGSTWMMWGDGFSAQDAVIMSLKMMLAMSAARSGFNLMYRGVKACCTNPFLFNYNLAVVAR